VKIGKTTTISADEAVKAFTLIGSAKPELLKSKEALVGVTNEAIALAEASDMDLPSAAESLTKVMNQFDLSANEAGRTINALAAGAKEGAAAIPSISESIVHFGAVAKTSNINLEQSVGLIETLAEKGVTGAEAGTKLRNVLVELSQGPNETNPKIVGLTKALQNLRDQGLSTEEMVKRFGKENIVAAQILTENADKVDYYTKAVTGTNEAYIQQERNTDNLDSSVKRFNNSIEALTLSFNGDGGLTKALTFVIDKVSSFINLLSEANKSIESIKKEVISENMAHMLEEDKKEIDEMGELFFKTLQIEIDVEKKRLATGTKNIEQLLMEKEIMGKIISSEIEMTAEDTQRANENIASLEERIKLGKQYIQLKTETGKEEDKTESGLKDDVVKKTKDLADKLREIEYKLQQYYQSSHYNELQDAHKRYDELRKLAEGNSAELIKIKELENIEISQINDRFKKQLADDTNKAADEFDKLLDAESKAFLDEEINVEKLEQQIKDISQTMADEWWSKLEAEEKRDIFGMTQEDWDALTEKLNVAFAFAGETLNAFAAYDNYLSQMEQDELDRYQRDNDAKKDILSKRLDAGLIDEKTYNRAIANSDAELDAKKQQIAIEQAERQKKLRTFETVINTAAAIVGFLANPGGIPGVILSLMAAATGAIQLAAINAAEAFASGGRIKERTFAMMGEAGEEGVLSNRTLTSPTTGPLANWLLDTQQGLNPRFPATIAPVIPQVSSYGSGAPLEATTQPQVVVQPADNSELLAEIRRMNEYLSDPKNRQSYILKDIMTKDAEEENFRTSIQKLK